METLFTPWRYAYITGQLGQPSECFLCAAAREPDVPERLVVHQADHHVVVLNRHPYSNGHLMVAPREHLARPAEASEAARGELWPLVLLCQQVLERAYSVDGMNLGMNLGRCGGAGVPDHFHFHVVPRWVGDTNFMTVVAETRIVPEDLEQTRGTLSRLFEELEGVE